MIADKLVLAKEGVFPIVKDKNGLLINSIPATNMAISGTVQGEGKLIGVPSLFIRLASCNLRCIWQLPDGSFSRCDTPYASFDANDNFQLTVDEIISLVGYNLSNLKHIVITGGEPLLQKGALANLAQELKRNFNVHITIESNGTIFDSNVAKHIDLFSISPKLKNSEPNSTKLLQYELKANGPLSYHGEKRLNLNVLQSYLDLCKDGQKDLQLKFVVAKKEDEQEIKDIYLSKLTNILPDNIMVMPLGANQNELKQTSALTLEMAIRNGWRFSSRLHIDLFGSKCGV